MVYSMTGFAALKGAYGDYAWSWDIRAVNAKGLDIRLRVPDWIEGLEGALRKSVGAAAARGNVSVSLRIARATGDGVLALNGTVLDRTLTLLAEISHAAEAKGLALAPMTAADLAGMRGVLDAAAGEEDTGPLLKALTAQLPELLASFNEMRAREGAALAGVLAAQVDRIEVLTAEAATLMEARSAAQAETLRASLARVMENTDGADKDRVAQELALIAVKTDVREELDRLVAHVAAARALLSGDAPRGRKLDFLMQEFNREANTLCSKAQFAELTRIGLDLKAVIDQMREQVQNVE
ncbi:YicC/YloC family endoribonuclease [Aliiroseovarius sp.]|uniref:YicC/YloC family endoribonuclease n=1 Tax=Aliiroseovarius sp. TaxID=1872442 RepID=UPI00260A7E3D|nr:YicC/YloC family endoribonuclease [Aliiroseovarius sp.]